MFCLCVLCFRCACVCVWRRGVFFEATDNSGYSNTKKYIHITRRIINTHITHTCGVGLRDGEVAVDGAVLGEHAAERRARHKLDEPVVAAGR